MNKREIIQLRALVKALDRESQRLSRKSHKVYKKAGMPADMGGSGDEGWADTFSIMGRANGLAEAASLLEKKLNKMEKRNAQRQR